jgi:hypothetical protein
LKIVENRFYQSSGLDLEHVVRDIEGVFMVEGYKVQHFGDQERMVVQFKQGGDLEALIGMQAALTLTLQKAQGGVIAVVGHQQWIDKALAGVIGAVFLWPLIITAGAGVIRQSLLEGQLLSSLDMVVRRQHPNVQVGPVPPDLMARMEQQQPPPYTYTQPGYQAAGHLRCANCQEPYEAGDAYCSRCGKPLTIQKRTCPKCHSEVKANAAFCAKCGTSLPTGSTPRN